MANRTLAIGDIHGCPKALAALVEALEPDRDDLVICLGDYIDRGPDSRSVLDQLIDLSTRCQLIPLLGNHEEMLLAALASRDALERWLRSGGTRTVSSYGWTPGGPRRSLADLIPTPHQQFLAGCRAYHETGTHFFVHAGYVADLPLQQQPGTALRWRVTDARLAEPHHSGKVVVVGHTPQLSGEVLDLGFLICIDTNCNRGGWLTALDVNSGTITQANAKGQLRG